MSSSTLTFPLLSSLTLRPATALQCSITNQNSYSSWGVKLTLPQYLARERLLAGLEHTRDRFTVWVLVPKNDEETLNIFCACETFKKNILIRTKIPDIGKG